MAPGKDILRKSTPTTTLLSGYVKPIAHHQAAPKRKRLYGAGAEHSTNLVLRDLSREKGPTRLQARDYITVKLMSSLSCATARPTLLGLVLTLGLSRYGAEVLDAVPGLGAQEGQDRRLALIKGAKTRARTDLAGN